MILQGAEVYFFWALALIALMSGLFTVLARSAVHSAICLMMTLIAVAGLFLLMQAEFVMGVQILVYVGESERAIQFHEQHLTIAREIGDRRGEGNALCNLGVVYYSQGNAQRAIHLYEQYLTIAREIGDRRGEGSALCNRSEERRVGKEC